MRRVEDLWLEWLACTVGNRQMCFCGMATYSNGRVNEEERRDDVYSERKYGKDGIVICRRMRRFAAAIIWGFHAIFDIPLDKATAHGGDMV